MKGCVRSCGKRCCRRNGLASSGKSCCRSLQKRNSPGGSITNVVRRCALYLMATGKKTLDRQILEEALQKETLKM